MSVANEWTNDSLTYLVNWIRLFLCSYVNLADDVGEKDEKEEYVGECEEKQCLRHDLKVTEEGYVEETDNGRQTAYKVGNVVVTDVAIYIVNHVAHLRKSTKIAGKASVALVQNQVLVEVLVYALKDFSAYLAEKKELHQKLTGQWGVEKGKDDNVDVGADEVVLLIASAKVDSRDDHGEDDDAGHGDGAHQQSCFASKYQLLKVLCHQGAV